MSKQSKSRQGIYQRGGIWYLDIRLPGGTRLRRSAGTQDKQQAQELRAKLEHELWQQTRLGTKPKRTWDEAAVKWLQEKGGKKSIIDDIRRLRRLGFLRGVYLHQISRKLVMDNVAAFSCGNSTKNRYLALIRSILYKAEREWEWIDKAPKLTLYQEPKKRIRWLTTQEAQRLVDALPGVWQQMALFSLNTGLRQSNVFGLTWEQVDLPHRTPWIHPDQAKNGRPLAVPLNDRSLDILSERMGMHRKYVFTQNGRVITKLNRKIWEKALADAGISDFRWHDFRHTWASWLIQSGVPVAVLKEMGGWESMAMVERYAHLSSAHLLTHSRALDNLMGGTVENSDTKWTQSVLKSRKVPGKRKSPTN